MEIIIAVVVAGVVMGLLDFIWLGFVAKKIYYDEMGGILHNKPNMVPALLFYTIYVIGVTVFVVDPALTRDSLVNAAGFGALFGLVAYATYDLTSLSVVKGFTAKIVVIDLLWGAVLTSIMATASFLVVQSWL